MTSIFLEFSKQLTEISNQVWKKEIHAKYSATMIYKLCNASSLDRI